MVAYKYSRQRFNVIFLLYQIFDLFFAIFRSFFSLAPFSPWKRLNNIVLFFGLFCYFFYLFRVAPLGKFSADALVT